MKKDFTDEFGPIDPKLFYSQIKAMAGCNTDNVIGIKGIGEKTAARYIYEKQKLSKKKINDIESNRELIERNLKLVKLPYKKTKHQEIRKNEFSKKKTIEIFQQFKFEYFLENFKKWSALWD